MKDGLKSLILLKISILYFLEANYYYKKIFMNISIPFFIALHAQSALKILMASN